MGVGEVGARVAVAAQSGVDQDLPRDAKRAVAPDGMGGGRRKIAACAVPREEEGSGEFGGDGLGRGQRVKV